MKEFRFILLIHGLIISLGLILLLLPVPIGYSFFIVVVLYNLGIPLLGYFQNNTQLIDIWIFSFGISILQVVPDWILAELLNVLVFPEDGLFKIGEVAGYMWGLWTIPFVLIIYTALIVQERTNDVKFAVISSAIAALLIFGISEMTLWRLGSWYAQNVSMTFHVAHYIIIPEVILGISVYLGYYNFKGKHTFNRYLIQPAITLLYVGAAITSYFFIEVL